MSANEHKNSQPRRELEWLAQYYYQHGFRDKAREIIDDLNATEPNNVVEMFENDEERRA